MATIAVFLYFQKLVVFYGRWISRGINRNHHDLKLIFTGESYNFNTTEKDVYMNLSKRPIIMLIALPKEYTGKVQANVNLILRIMIQL